MNTKKIINSVAKKSGDYLRKIIKNHNGKTIAIGAVAGAAIASPVPLIWPVAGALIGGGLAAFKHLSENTKKVNPDILSDLERLGELMEKGHITVEEFEAEKKKLLDD